MNHHCSISGGITVSQLRDNLNVRDISAKNSHDDKAKIKIQALAPRPRLCAKVEKVYGLRPSVA